MAWKEQCEIQFRASAEALIAKKGITVREVLRQQSQESGIPYGTLQRWYYRERNEGGVSKNEHTTSTKGQPEVWQNIFRRFKALANYMEANVDLSDESYVMSQKTKEAFREVLARIDLEMIVGD